MAFDFVQQLLEIPTPGMTSEVTLSSSEGRPFPALGSTLQWRQAIFSIVHDSMSLIERPHAGEHDYTWCREAYRRSLNFSELAFSELPATKAQEARQDRQSLNLTAIATLAGAYRMLAKCVGPTPVQCKHLFSAFLTNLALAYAPACGDIELSFDLCSLVLRPVECRALILCAGMLIQARLRQSIQRGVGARLDVKLTTLAANTCTLELLFEAGHANLLDTVEFDMACRLCGVFQSDLRCAVERDGCLRILLSFIPFNFP